MAYGVFVYVINSPGTIDCNVLGTFATSEAATAAATAVASALTDAKTKVNYVIYPDVMAEGYDESRLLPATFGTAGDILTVNAGADGAEWVTPT